MKIAISSPDGKADSEFSGRFGRCEYFILMQTDTDEWEKVKNPARGSRGGSGPQVVQFLANQGVDVIISGRYGPNAYTALQASAVEPYLAQSGTPLDLLGAFREGKLRKAAGPSGPGHHR